MGKDDVYLTREGYEKLREELEYLKGTRRRELSKAIEKARSHGDISENAEYDAAKEAQGLNEKRIAELEGKLSHTRMIDGENIPKDEARVGATVKLKDLNTGEEIAYILVSEAEADFSENKISITSPVGKALLGRKEKDEVQIKIPAGILKYKVVKISR
ncbi:MAG: transcription elongation factor GreA [Candidatus Omnitrophica bacterium CG07_land_8_20_14_0_80_42_15]|uniref:Transcription elongation factor GreA n=1 Tax=Candidatus Aquitaenariimonas noxiae TaxID=1974741 RepID=A0A2J0KRY0_9BACT|nr:MAG: transcription elongation factor GreA [Candidatus Omnitrophica bacterium CG07_land_8_20_14_0_80_42_15]